MMHLLIADPNPKPYVIDVYNVCLHSCIEAIIAYISEFISFDTENFMTGYHIVFNRENNVLGWKASECEYINYGNSLPV